MSPTPEEIEIGAKAHERVRLYEKYGTRNARQLPWILAGCAVFLILMFFWLKIDFHSHDFFMFFIFIPAAIVGWGQNRIAKESYANHKMLLKFLEEKYGDALPWVVEEKQLARALELEATIAREQHAFGHA